jgi:hypothetical protein
MTCNQPRFLHYISFSPVIRPRPISKEQLFNSILNHFGPNIFKTLIVAKEPVAAGGRRADYKLLVFLAFNAPPAGRKFKGQEIYRHLVDIIEAEEGANLNEDDYEIDVQGIDDTKYSISKITSVDMRFLVGGTQVNRNLFNFRFRIFEFAENNHHLDDDSEIIRNFMRTNRVHIALAKEMIEEARNRHNQEENVAQTPQLPQPVTQNIDVIDLTSQPQSPALVNIILNDSFAQTLHDNSDQLQIQNSAPQEEITEASPAFEQNDFANGDIAFIEQGDNNINEDQQPSQAPSQQQAPNGLQFSYLEFLARTAIIRNRPLIQDVPEPMAAEVLDVVVEDNPALDVIDVIDETVEETLPQDNIGSPARLNIIPDTPPREELLLNGHIDLNFFANEAMMFNTQYLNQVAEGLNQDEPQQDNAQEQQDQQNFNYIFFNINEQALNLNNFIEPEPFLNAQYMAAYEQMEHMVNNRNEIAFLDSEDEEDLPPSTNKRPSLG